MKKEFKFDHEEVRTDHYDGRHSIFQFSAAITGSSSLRYCTCVRVKDECRIREYNRDKRFDNVLEDINDDT